MFQTSWSLSRKLKQQYHRYWDWTLDANDIEASPLFDGSPYSMSGNGEYVANRSALITELTLPSIGSVIISIPPGTGGGCVTTGPFANITVPFGEVSTNTTTSSRNNPQNLAHTPHCLRRDLNPAIVNVSLTAAQVETQLESVNITVFTQNIEVGANPAIQNLHAGGHFGEF